MRTARVPSTRRRRPARLRRVSGLLIVLGAACSASTRPPAPLDQLSLTDGRTIRLGQSASEIGAQVPAEAGTPWRAESGHDLQVAVDGGRVVAIVARPSGADLPIPGYGFGASFEQLRRGVPELRPIEVADRPALLLERPAFQLYALATRDRTTCETRPEVTQVALVVRGFEPLVQERLASEKCIPLPPPITVFPRDVDGNMEIFMRDNRTQVETRLTTNPAEDSYPRIVYRSLHRRGARVVFQSNRDGNFEIYVMDLDGSGQRRLTSSPADDMYPDWSPDERSVVFVSNRDGNREIYVMAADGSNLRRLTDSPGIDNGPVWASNVRLNGGTDIAFYSDRDGNYDVYVMAPDGTNVRRLTDNPALDYNAAWSPDGTRIAFVSERDGNKEIYVMNADGSAQTRLTDSAAAETAPLWSHDGKRITFSSDRDGADARYSMNADGTGQVKTDQVR